MFVMLVYSTASVSIYEAKEESIGEVIKDFFTSLPLKCLKFFSVSTAIGFGMGVFCCLSLKYIRTLTHSATSEITYVLMCGLISYFLGDLSETSGVASIIITGLMMSIYGYYSLSP